MPRQLLAVFGILTTFGGAVAQATHLVGPGGHAEIRDAIAQASPGDVVLVMPGTYDMFTLHKGLTIWAPLGGVSVEGFWSNMVSVPAGTRVTLVGMRLQGLSASGGLLTLDDCTFDGPNGRVTIFDSVAVIQGCTFAPAIPPLVGGSAALRAVGSEVTLIDSILRGTRQTATALPGEAIRLENSRLRASGLDLEGGVGTPLVAALRLDGSSRVWISDSVLVADPASCAVFGALGRRDRCVFSPDCAGGLSHGLVLGVRRGAAPRSGQWFALEYRALPGMPVGVFVDFALERSLHPQLEQALLLPAATAANAGLLIADGNGVAHGAWFVPPGPWSQGQAVWFQGFGGLTHPLQASALAGGVVR